ncbi:glycosyltransferase [Pedobacter rhodius]|uniref:Glycosyltransferase n=1 Tax=Pedobacter rhodius TaxID=3004098 RepID=A0ABT4KUF2_9SPHI|nr:glycosyltransferase [Pedobacter sp. SJ11]MCZ4222543.1 glycosyltransferase [Pedobacter sp. SJ11]
MSFTIAFYVHHHGSGHLMRTLQVARQLTAYKVILLGSQLQGLEEKNMENIQLIHLPADVPDTAMSDNTGTKAPDTFHYAPLNIEGIRDRMAIMAELFRKEYPLLLVVDVSVEVTLLARLCAVPTVVIRQHGLRDDLPHLMAYQSAEILLAPFSGDIYIGKKDWIYNKTVFTGGFSRFSRAAEKTPEIAKHVVILIGGGGTSINTSLIKNIAKACPEYIFHVVGVFKQDQSLPNLFWHGKVANPQSLLESCQFIIGNTGHNTVMEVATLNKRFIGIPEKRPFQEQKQKAESIQHRNGIKIIAVEDLTTQDWKAIFEQLSYQLPDWKGIIDNGALFRMAQAIIDTGNNFFKI